MAVFLLFFRASGGNLLGEGAASGSEWLIVWNAGAKAVLGVLSVSLLGLTTSFPELDLGPRATA